MLVIYIYIFSFEIKQNNFSLVRKKGKKENGESKKKKS
mgnify:CR=1 FL=1